MRRRLLIITDEMEVGGTQRQIVELARHLDRAAFDVEVAYFRNGSRHVDELREAGIAVTCIPKRRRFDAGFLLRLCRFLRKGDFDIVHAFSFSGEVWGWLANLLAGRARFVSSARSVYEWYSPLQWHIKRFVALNSAALVANSEAGAEYAALQMGVRRGSVQVVHNGMRFPAELADAVERRAQRADGAYRVLFVGRLVGHKNLRCLLRAFATVADALPNAVLDIVGEGPDRDALLVQAQRLGIAERVHLHGERDDVNAFLVNADVFVCCSHREGLSNAIMEAMCAGLPVVASNVGGNSELVVHEETGMLFPPDDEDSLAAMLIELAGDPVLRRRLGENGCARLKRNHDPRRLAADMERIYERCLLEESACAVER